MYQRDMLGPQNTLWPATIQWLYAGIIHWESILFSSVTREVEHVVPGRCLKPPTCSFFVVLLDDLHQLRNLQDLSQRISHVFLLLPTVTGLMR